MAAKKIDGWRKIRARIKGIAPILMHNGKLADPLYEWTKAMKEITSKRKKSDQDYLELARCEFMGSLYVDEVGAPCITGDMIDGCFVAAAKKIRLGDQAKVAEFSVGNWPLIYDGPKDAEKLWADGRFRDTRGVKVQKNRVMRTRPRFDDWACEFEITYDANVLNFDQVEQILEIMGSQRGFGDYLPKFGRFTVEWIKEVATSAAA